MKRILSLLTAVLLILNLAPILVFADTEVRYIGREYFDYADYDALKQGDGIVLTETVAANGTVMASTTVEDGQVTMVRTLDEELAGVADNGANYTAGIRKYFEHTGKEYLTGTYRGEFQFTQVNGANLLISAVPTLDWNQKFSLEMTYDGTVLTYPSSLPGGKAFTGALDHTFRVEYEIDEDADKVSVWITDVTAGSERILAIDNENFQKPATNGQNCASLNVQIKLDKAHAKDGRGVTLDYAVFGYADGFDALRAADALTEESILGQNFSLNRVSEDLVLPTEGSGGTQISWQSSMESVIAQTGKVTPALSDVEVTLTATVAKDGFYTTKSFQALVRGSSGPAPASDDIDLLKTEKPSDFAEVALSPKSSTTVDTEETNLYDYSLKVMPEGSSTGKGRLIAPPIAPTDITGYQYLNLWMHSSGEPGQVVGIVVMDSRKDTDYSIKYNSSGNPKNLVGLRVDWVDAPGEWHLISLPLSDFVTVGDFDPTTVSRMRFGFVGNGGILREGSVLNFERVWLSVNKPSEADFTRKAQWIGSEQFTYASYDALRSGNGILLSDGEEDAKTARVLTGDGQVVMTNLTQGAAGSAASLQKSFTANGAYYKTGGVRGEFQYTQIEGGVIRAEVGPSGGGGGVFSLTQDSGGAVRVTSGGGTVEYRTAAENLNRTLRVEYETDEDLDQVSVWVSDVTDGADAARTQLIQSQPFADSGANGQNSAAVTFAVDGASAAGAGISLDYAVLARPDDFKALQELAHITMKDILGENTTEKLVTKDLVIPAESRYGAHMVWTSTRPDVIAEDGSVTVFEDPMGVTMRVTVNSGGKQAEAAFSFTVVSRMPTEQEQIENVINSFSYDDLLNSGQSAEKLIGNLKTPPTEIDGVSVQWTSTNPAVISNAGKVTQADTETAVTLRAVLTLGTARGTMEFPFVVMAKARTIYERDFDNGDLSHITFKTLVADSEYTQGVENGQYTITKISDAGATYNEAVEAFIPFSVYDIPYDEATRTGVYKNALAGVYEVEVTCTSLAKGEFAIFDLRGANGSEATMDVARVFVKPNVIQTYLYPNYFNLLSDNTSNKEYTITYKVDTQQKRYWMYINGSPAGNAEGYGFFNQMNTINGLRLCMKDGARAGDYIKINKIRIEEIERVENAQEAVLDKAMAQLSISALTATPEAVTKSLNALPDTVGGVGVTWTSSNPDLIASNGTLLKTPTGVNEDVVMTASFKSGASFKYKEFKLTVTGDQSASAKLKAVADTLTLATLTDESAGAVTQSLKTLPTSGEYETQITWSSSRPDYMTDAGVLLKRDVYADVPVQMKAVLSLNGETLEKVFDLKIKIDEEKGMFPLTHSDFAGGMDENWTTDAAGGMAAVENQWLVLRKTDAAGEPAASMALAQSGGTVLPVKGLNVIETAVTAENRCQKGVYSVTSTAGTEAFRLVFEVDREIGSPTINRQVFYGVYSTDSASDRGEEQEVRTQKQVLESGRTLRVRTKIDPVTGRMSAWIDDTLIVDQQYTLRAVENVAYASFRLYEENENRGGMRIGSVDVSMNRGRALEMLADNLTYSEGVSDGAYLDGDVALYALKALGTSSSWTSSEPEMISETGAFNMPEENTPAVLTLRIWFDDTEDVSLERAYHVTGLAVNTGNLARGKVVTTTADGTTAHRAAKAVDGIYDTAWLTMRVEKTPELTIDLGKTMFIDSYRLMEAQVNGAYPVKAYVLEGSLDGAAWTELRGGGAIGEDTGVLECAMSKVRYVRYRVTEKAMGNSGLNEIELYFNPTPQERDRAELELIDLGITGPVTEDIALPAVGEYGSAITYTSSAPDVISATGRVNRQPAAVSVVLTAHIGDQSRALPPIFVSAKPGGGGSGSGGSGGSGGGGSISGGSGIAVNPPAETQRPDADVFGDVPETHWAHAYIRDLKERGVVSGDENGNFQPERSVTREEFTKILLGTLEIAPEGAAGFLDVQPGDWFAGYVAKAAQLGIVNGRPDGSFGVGEDITREDMAVMCARAAAVRGLTLETNGKADAFADEAEISGYAVEAVYTMRKAGILGGYEDGTFQPKNSATRAETAKIAALLN